MTPSPAVDLASPAVTQPTLITVELHCHTWHSKDSLVLPGRLIEICRRRRIDRLAVTDHNRIAGALQTRDLAPDLVIVGEEIMTRQGELLAFFVEQEIPAGLQPEEAIDRLRQQGAFISVSHPFDHVRSGAWREDDLRHILPLVDAIEIYNSRTWSEAPNFAAWSLAQQTGTAGTAGSDAHTYAEVGQARMRLPSFNSAEELRQVIDQAELQVRHSAPWVHLASRYAVWRKRLGWSPPGS
jgi:predicted metal-dependent phosphoesterase TrpH